MIPKRSLALISWFTWYGNRFLRRHFHAVRVSKEGKAPEISEGPLVIVLNHPSWWDPLVSLALTRFFPGRKHYAPMDAAALKKYRFFGKLGFFGVEQETSRGALSFLRTSCEILSSPGTALWITGQGRFSDPRESPLGLQAGVAHLARRLKSGTILPLALEYPFWTERFPEALARFGEPLLITGRSWTVDKWTRSIEDHLSTAMSQLSREAIRRDPNSFDVVLQGTTGVNLFYDLWRALGSTLRGRRFRAAHGETGKPEHPEGK